MGLTKDFLTTIKARADRDPAYRIALLREAMDCLLEGDLDTGKSLLRDFVNATMGFEALAGRVKVAPKSLHRMLGPNGNPRANNLLRVLAAIQQSEQLDARVQLRRAA